MEELFRNFIRTNHLTAIWEEFLKQNKTGLNEADTVHLIWIYNRLLGYGENENVDFMLRLSDIINKVEIQTNLKP